MTTIANQRWISIRNIIIYLETKFRPNRKIFVIWRPFWIQDGHHSKPTMDINSQHHNLLGSQISSQSEDFCISAAILDGRQSKPKCSPYGTAGLTSCKYPFPLKSFHFWIFNNLYSFYIGCHFENFKNKEHNFEWWSIFVSFQKHPAYGVNLTFFTCWLPWQRPPFWKNFNPPKAATHYGGYSYKVS